MNNDTVEFWIADKMVFRVRSSIVPAVGSRISILQKAYKITHVSLSLDGVNGPMAERCLRCNVDIKELK